MPDSPASTVPAGSAPGSAAAEPAPGTAAPGTPTPGTAAPDLPSAAARSVAARHARTVSELLDRQALTLESLLATLRSGRLDDRAARTVAIEVAAAAVVELRSETHEQRSLLLEPVAGAFARLRDDLRTLVRFGELDVQFVEPPATGRALPGEVAHAARTIVRSTLLALVDDGRARRVRIQWDCDGLHLLMAVRDDGAGELTAHDDSLRPVAERVSALDGTLSVSSTPGWGSDLTVSLPLDPPVEPGSLDDAVSLSPRERDVLRLVASGARNRAVAESLGISENTVKFHVSNLLRKAGAATRAELTALAR